MRELVVRQYQDSPSARLALFEFYREVYPGSPWLLENGRHEWQNLGNPLLEDAGSEIWLLYDQDRIVGQNIYILYNLSIDRQVHRGYCSTNLIVKPGMEGKGHGHKLIEVNENRGGIAYAVGITPASTRAFQKRGWKLLEDARLFSGIINPIPNLRYMGLSRTNQMLLAPLLKCASVLWNLATRLCTPKCLETVEYREVERFDPEWDKYWRLFLKDYAIHFDRNFRHLNYKYTSRKDVEHIILLFEMIGKPVGYGVHRVSENRERGIRLGRIVDLVYDPSKGKGLLSFMLKTMKQRLLSFGIDGLVGIAANSEIASAYRSNGFFLSRVQPAIIREDGFSLDDLRIRYKDLWYITLGDSDLDNYW